MSDKTKCSVCDGTDVQICLPAWFDPDDLTLGDIDFEADARSTWCNDCMEHHTLIMPDGRRIIGD